MRTTQYNKYNEKNKIKQNFTDECDADDENDYLTTHKYTVRIYVRWLQKQRSV